MLSRPLLSGFVNAVAVIIFINQMEPFLGLASTEHEQAWQKIVHIVTRIERTHVFTLLVGIMCLLILVACRLIKWRFSQAKWPRYLIDPFIIVVLCISLSYALDFEQQGLPFHYYVDYSCSLNDCVTRD